jgi:hypothetical protein
MFTFKIMSAKKSNMTDLVDRATDELLCLNSIKYPLNCIKKL